MRRFRPKKRSELETEDGIPVLLGKYVIVDCGDGISIRYTYLDTVLVEVGQRVSTGDVLGTAGNTGGSIGYDDQCGVFVMQDGLMVDPLLFFNVSTDPAVYPTGIEWEGAGYSWLEGY